MIDNLQNKETIDQAKRKFIKDYHSTSRHLHSEIAKLNSLMTGGYGTSSQRIKLDAVLSYETNLQTQFAITQKKAQLQLNVPIKQELINKIKLG